MGKLVRFDVLRRKLMPRTGRAQSNRRAARRWDPSAHFIVNTGFAAFFIFFVSLYYWPVPIFLKSAAATSSHDPETASFGFCHSGGGYHCVVDGDTIYYRGEKIRIADIDTPETHDYGCAYELELGNAATQRLIQLLNNGAFSLASIDRDTDRYGRLLRIAERDGKSIGGVLVDEGLARRYEGGRRPWC